ncbi:Ferric siderophore transport system, biopolymer transport protein ExbB [Moritella sp. JT01]|uniref:MotA/TolQ/ExbB proton channel family protein n=1 Tax=Moritella sp. JT01 TaxID=756698 RepID=UPI00079425A6|nr:MotA/TolQ/ExbB proton channel family protein [Moritella sp. JT01]KXO12783.1 Ferric siderophore transport system, biopolymer transport protein ExbB [Moritella sp. JT01]
MHFDITSVDWLESVNQFMQQGGPILYWLAAVVMLCWFCVMERLLYLYCYFPALQRDLLTRWQARSEQDSWHAQAIRGGWLLQAQQALQQNLSFLKVLVAICPMLGLLGTVTGMISVFDVMATLGSSEPKLMAAGISLATLPTMAGMVAALAGMFAHARLTKACDTRYSRLEKLLRLSIKE